jgi:hypothetical protein
MSQKDDAEAERLSQMLQALDTGLPVESPTLRRLIFSRSALSQWRTNDRRVGLEASHGERTSPARQALTS